MNSWFAFKAPPISGHPFERDSGAGSYASACLVYPSWVRPWPRRASAPVASTSRRDRAPVADQGRFGLRQRRPLAQGQNEVETDAPGRLRLAMIKDFSAASLHGFVAADVAPGATIKTDGRPSYTCGPTSGTSHVVGAMAAHAVLPWIHRAFSTAKLGARRLSRGYRGLRRQHQRRPLGFYLDQCNMVTDRSGKVSLRNRTTRFSSQLFVTGILICFLAG